MLNNTALEVAIGFTFIFLIYSLLSTTLKECLAALFAYRARMLERAIEQMMDGRNIRYFWWDKLINYFLWLRHAILTWWINKKNKTAWAKEKTGNKEVPNQEKQSTQATPPKPSTQPTSSPQPKPPTPQPRLTASEYTLDKLAPYRLYSSDEFQKMGIRRIKLNSKGRLLAASITEHPLYRRAASGGVINKKPAYLSSDTFSDILLDVLSPHPGQPTLLSEISSEIDRREKDPNDPLNQQLHSILRLYLTQANGDLQRFKRLLEDWYDKSMDRVTGWYKQQAQAILFLIGLVLAFTFNVDSIAIYRVLAKDKTARDGLVQMAIHSKMDTTATYSMLKTQADQASSILGLGRPYSDTCQICKDLQEKLSKKQISASIEPYKSQLENCTRFWKEDEQRPFLQKSPRQTGGVMTIVGFLLTALAISLGAPFWFDLLNKLVRMRFAGDKPADTVPGSKAVPSKTDSLNKKPDPAAIG